MRASARYRARVARFDLGKALTEIGGARSLTRIPPRDTARRWRMAEIRPPTLLEVVHQPVPQ